MPPTHCITLGCTMGVGGCDGVSTARVVQRPCGGVPSCRRGGPGPELTARAAILRAAVTRDVSALEPWLAADFERRPAERRDWLTTSA